MNPYIAIQTLGRIFTVFSYLIESLPRKSNFIWLLGKVSMCCTLKEQHPTVSAYYSLSFSFPALKAKISIK